MTSEELIRLAIAAKNNAIANFTGYKVGAAILTKLNKIYTGCNIESSISGLGNCAERVAMQNALSNGEREFIKIAIVGGMNNNIDKTLTPCGACRQYMLDFAKDIKIICYINGVIKELDLLHEMLPYTFDYNEKNI